MRLSLPTMSQSLPARATAAALLSLFWCAVPSSASAQAQPRPEPEAQPGQAQPGQAQPGQTQQPGPRGTNRRNRTGRATATTRPASPRPGTAPDDRNEAPRPSQDDDRHPRRPRRRPWRR